MLYKLPHETSGSTEQDNLQTAENNCRLNGLVWRHAYRPSHRETIPAEHKLTLILLTWTIWRAPTNASKWRMGFNSTFKGLTWLTERFLSVYLRWELSAQVNSSYSELYAIYSQHYVILRSFGVIYYLHLQDGSLYFSLCQQLIGQQHVLLRTVCKMCLFQCFLFQNA